MTLYIGDKPVGLMKVVKDTKYIDKTKYGVSIDNLLGNVDANGECVPDRTPFTFDATSIVDVPNTTSGSNDYFTHKFYYNKGLTGTIDLSNMTGVSGNARLEYTFYATNVQKAITPRPLTDASKRARFEYTFGFCESLKEIVFSDPIIGGYGHACFYYAFQSGKFADATINFGDIVKLDWYGLYSTFRYCELPDEIRFTSLTEIADQNAFLQAFADIKAGGKRFYFPALTTTVSSKVFGTSSSNLTWNRSTGVEEIHFRADMQATIESQYGYSSKFGATNATIYFDL